MKISFKKTIDQIKYSPTIAFLLVAAGLIIISLAIPRHHPAPPAPKPVPLPPAPTPKPVPPPPAEDAIIEQTVIEHNKRRVDHNKSPLVKNDKLMRAAQKHAAWMAEWGRLAHVTYSDGTPFSRMKKEGYDWTYAGENIAYGQETPKEVVDAWMSDFGHRHNVLGGYVHIGVGYAKDKHGRIYWCTDFGSTVVPGDGYNTPYAAHEVKPVVGNNGTTSSMSNLND